MTTSAPQWPGQEGAQHEDEIRTPETGPKLLRTQATPAQTPPLRPPPAQGALGHEIPGHGVPGHTDPGQGTLTQETLAQGTPRQGTPAQANSIQGAPAQGTPAQGTALGAGGSETARRLQPVPDLPAGLEDRTRQQQQGRAAARRNRFVVVRDSTDRDLRAARRRARASLPSPAAVTRGIALALLEVEAGCRSASQLERVVSRELWEELEPCIGRRGGPLPSGRSVMSVQCQEDMPGLADTVAVVRKGDLVRPVALRLDAGGGRWVVTELRWWRNETDTATTPGRDDRYS